MQEAVGWVRRRWLAVLLATSAVALLAVPSATPWLALLGAAAAAYFVYFTCVRWGLGGTLVWSCGRVDGLERRAVLITGCDTGFGHATALRLHFGGVGRVFACVLHSDSPGAKALRGLGSRRMRVIPCDVTDAASVADAHRAVSDDLHASGYELLAIVNNAGVLSMGGSEWMDIEQLKRVFEVNTVGQVRVTQAFNVLLRKSKGRVVNVNSIASRIPVMMLTPYVMSKYASLSFTDTLRIDMSDCPVSVHSIEPWIYMTNMGEIAFPMLEKSLNEIPAELKSVYSKNYSKILLMYVQLVLKVFSNPGSKVEEVVSAIEDACLSKYPENRYVPGFVGKLMDTLHELITTVQYIATKLSLR